MIFKSVLQFTRMDKWSVIFHNYFFESVFSSFYDVSTIKNSIVKFNYIDSMINACCFIFDCMKNLSLNMTNIKRFHS